MRPKVTIGIIAFNAEKIISSAIESVAMQDYDHRLMELILVDDGSKDNTLQVMKAYASKIDISTQVFSGEWRGIGYARNKVVENANGIYILWLDADEVIESDFVRKQTTLLELNPRAGIAKAQLRVWPDENMIQVLDGLPAIADLSFRDGRKPAKMPGTGGAIYRLAAIKQVGGFNEMLKGVGEDIEAAYRITQKGWSIVIGNAVYYEIRGGLTTWRAALARGVKRGRDSKALNRETTKVFSIYAMNPLASFVVSLRWAVLGYKATKRKVAFLLPVFYTAQMVAWLYGFGKKAE